MSTVISLSTIFQSTYFQSTKFQFQSSKFKVQFPIFQSTFQSTKFKVHLPPYSLLKLVTLSLVIIKPRSFTCTNFVWID